MRGEKPITPHTHREIADYMADGIEKSAEDCRSLGAIEKADRMMAWAAKVRAGRDEPDEPEDAPAQADLFAEKSE
jgi:hypothetical protein